MSYIEQSLSTGENLEGVFKSKGIKPKAIEAVEINQGISGRIFGFGSIKVTGYGASDACFNFVHDPIAVKRQIESVAHPVE